MMSFNYYIPRDFIILTGSAHPKLAQKVAKLLGKKVDEPIESSFPDGTDNIKIHFNIRRRDVFVIQPTVTPVDKHIMELLFILDAADRSSAGELTAVCPYFGYARQDRKDRPRVSINSKVVADLIMSRGARRIVTVDIHSDQQQGYINGPWDNLFGIYSLAPVLQEMLPKRKLVIAAPDAGGIKRARHYQTKLKAKGLVEIDKIRSAEIKGVSSVENIYGEINGKDVLIVDDMIDTGGTISNAAKEIVRLGARSVSVVATHGVFSNNALEKLDIPEISKIFITDTIPQSEEVLKNEKFIVVSVAPMIAEAIKCIFTGESLSERLF